MDEHREQTHILGAKIDLLSKKEVLSRLKRFLSSRLFHHVVTLNPEIALKAEKDHEYRKLINKAALTTADGFGLKIGAFLLGTQTPNRFTGGELMHHLFQMSAREQVRIYLLGGKGDTAQRAAICVKKRYPNVKIVGAEEGVNPKRFRWYDQNLIDRINASKAQILFVALGAPIQEEWIQKNRPYLHSIRIAIGIGGQLDYLAGNVPHPPRFLQWFGLEWLFRLITQPKRFKRIVQAVIVFPLYCLYWRIRMLLRFRKNVVAIIQNRDDEILLVTPAWSRTVRWQFPQGGVDPGEHPDESILREMEEELGTSKFEILASYPRTYRYKWPQWYRRLRGYRGQKQDLYFLKFTGSDEDFNLQNGKELAAFKWVHPQFLLQSLSPARKEIGQIVLQLLRR